MSGFFDRILGLGAGKTVLRGDARIHYLTYRINFFTIVFGFSFSVFFLAIGLPRVAIIVAMVAMSWIGARVLMRLGHPDGGRLLQHATGLTLLAFLGVALGPEVNAHMLLVVTASMAPITWSQRESTEWSIHVGMGFVLWAMVESGLFDQFVMVQVAEDLAAFLRIAVGLMIFGFLGLITRGLIRENQITELHLEEANTKLKLEIQERSRIEHDLAEARDAAQRADRVKNDFLASMSHEIRTPMNTIIGLARQCAQNSLAPRVRECIDRIRSSSHALLGIINDILDLSRIEAREIELDEVSFDLWGVLDHLTDLVGERASAKGVEFLVAVDPDVPRLLIGDPLRLVQILTNLSNNAVKFTADGSVVVRVQLHKHNGDDIRLGFVVEDTGLGIPEHLIAGIFESFVQADGSTTRRFGGSGLGLTISKMLVELMGGVIQVESKVGKGSRFSFVVTFAQATSETVAKHQPPRELEGLRVMVVHDNPVTSDVMCSLLSSLTFVPRSVQSEAECLQELTRAKTGPQPYGLVLVDWPDSIEICRRITADARLKEIPIVVMVTSKHYEEMNGFADQTGIAGVLIKPIRAGAVLDVVTEVFGHESTILRRRLATSGFIPAVHLIQGAKILVVEDDEGNQRVARAILEDAGLEVTVVSDGQQAVREVSERSYDLVLMDVHIPRLDGPAATKVLRADSKLAQVPIIAMTADALNETRLRCFEAGMNDFVAKPISVSELLTKVVHWIGADANRRVEPAKPPKNRSIGSKSKEELCGDSTAVSKGSGTQSSSDSKTWFSRLIGFGVPGEGATELNKRRRLANGLVLVLLAISVVYIPIYLVMGLPAIAGITAAMGTMWLVSYGLLIWGWHRSGRVLAVLVAFVGCTAYAFAFGPRANYHALLFNGLILPPIMFTFRERRTSWGCAIMAVSLWLLTESGVLAHLAFVEASDTMFALLHANAGLICFGFIGFSVCLLVRENYEAEERLQAVHDQLQAEIEFRVQAEKLLVDARDAAEDARMAKSEFLANMSHEIRTPMNAIIGLTDLCQRAELEAPVRDQVSRIQVAANTLLRIINDILDLSRLEAHKIVLEEVDFNLDLMFDQVVASVGHLASNKAIELLVVTEPDVPRTLVGDPFRLEQVLKNLVENAVRATERGEVVVRVERTASEPDPAALRFQVSDTGIGFPFESIEEFNEAIGRRDRPRSGRDQGPGLGLTISRDLVELMGSDLFVKSERGIGTRFWFDMPLKRGSEEKAFAATPVCLVGTRVLIVSLHPIGSDVLCRLVASYGFLPTLAASPKTAQERWRVAAEQDLPFELIIVDCPRGSTEGMEFLQSEVRETEGPASLRLVFARDLANLVSPAEAAGLHGAADVVVKPMGRLTLLDAILAALGKSEPETGADEMPSDLRFAVSRVSGARVLVAEDNEANQLVARGILEDEGLRVDLVSNGREALEAVVNSTFDMVLMDLHMPEMDGYEATRKIRQKLGKEELPIIAMTADSRSETRQVCAEAGMNDHVSKPVNRIELLTNLVKWIDPRDRCEIECEIADEKEVPRIEQTPENAVALPAELPGINLREALDRLSGQQNTLVEVLKSFDRRFRGHEAEIEEAWRMGDVEQALELLHLMKGLAGNISARELYNRTTMLEQAMRGDEAVVPGLIVEHRRALDQVMSSLVTIDHTLNGGTVEGDRGGSAEVIDPESLRVQLEELLVLLTSSSLRARGVFRELSGRLDKTTMGSDLQVIADDVNGLNFTAARDKLLEFVGRYGINIESRKE